MTPRPFQGKGRIGEHSRRTVTTNAFNQVEFLPRVKLGHLLRTN